MKVDIFRLTVPALKALGFQLLELVESKVLSTSWFQQPTWVHPYTTVSLQEAGYPGAEALKAVASGIIAIDLGKSPEGSDEDNTSGLLEVRGDAPVGPAGGFNGCSFHVMIGYTFIRPLVH